MNIRILIKNFDEYLLVKDKLFKSCSFHDDVDVLVHDIIGERGGPLVLYSINGIYNGWDRGKVIDKKNSYYVTHTLSMYVTPTLRRI